ncbi:ComF family protein [Acinetobacter cumulans]|uniref:ComF family protein n=2 Tax=Acinetobacter TaxID=469 RepID=UPI003969BDB7
MPMYNPKSNSILQQLTGLFRSFQPCQLCHADTQHWHQVCEDCWKSLPWQRQTIKRQGLQIMTPCRYDYPLDRIIQQYKYQQQLQFQPLLSGLLCSLKQPKKVQAIVPMPISTERLEERGFNQSLLIAQDLAKHLDVPIWQPVTRLKQHAQKGLSRLERMSDIQQQFQLTPPNAVRYRNVLIVDDVVTTGSSIQALHNCLIELGCQQVHVTCLAVAEI